MTFHIWTLLYIGAALFSAGAGIYFLRSERKPLSKLCLAVILFILAAWAVLDFVAGFADDVATSTLAVESLFLLIGFIPAFFFLIPYSMRNKINNKTMPLFVIPIILAYIVLFTPDFAVAEHSAYGYHVDYNVPAVAAWSAIFIATIVAGFYLFYKIYLMLPANKGLRIKIKYFCIGCAIAMLAAFGLNVLLAILYDVPHLGSIFTCIGTGIVFLSFRF